MRCTRSFLISILFLLAGSRVAAAEYRLFTPGPEYSVANPNYHEIVMALKPGDKVSFSDGSVVELGEKVGNGNTAVVFSVASDRSLVIRIPCPSEKVKSLTAVRAAVNTYAGGNIPLLQLGADVPKVKGGLQTEFLLVERVLLDRSPGQDFSLNEFLTRQNQMPKALREEAETALIDYAKQTAAIAAIADNHSEQYIYSRSQKRWFLLDWSPPIVTAFSTSRSGDVNLGADAYKPSILQNAMKLSNSKADASKEFKDLSDRIGRAVKRERIRMMDSEPERARVLSLVSARAWPALVRKRLVNPMLTEAPCYEQFARFTGPIKRN